MMATTERDQLYGTYRCPVCGHRDAVTLEASQGSLVLECSYCDTPLEVSARGADSVRFTVQVADESAA